METDNGETDLPNEIKCWGSDGTNSTIRASAYCKTTENGEAEPNEVQCWGSDGTDWTVRAPVGPQPTIVWNPPTIIPPEAFYYFTQLFLYSFLIRYALRFIVDSVKASLGSG
jgi:hypothetical protein